MERDVGRLFQPKHLHPAAKAWELGGFAGLAG